MKKVTVVGTFLALALSTLHTAVAAGVIFVGSWNVEQGPSWGEYPLAYTGQEAAAHLFGGNASDYAISTVSSNIDSIDHLAWYSIIGVAGGHKLAEDYSNKLPGGLYYDNGFSYNIGDLSNPASAYVDDNALGYTNYAFRIAADTDVPAPASLVLLGTALLGFAGLRRRVRA